VVKKLDIERIKGEKILEENKSISILIKKY
jgi:hypothetical protein